MQSWWQPLEMSKHPVVKLDTWRASCWMNAEGRTTDMLASSCSARQLNLCSLGCINTAAFPCWRGLCGCNTTTKSVTSAHCFMRSWILILTSFQTPYWGNVLGIENLKLPVFCEYARPNEYRKFVFNSNCFPGNFKYFTRRISDWHVGVYVYAPSKFRTNRF